MRYGFVSLLVLAPFSAFGGGSTFAYAQTHNEFVAPTSHTQSSQGTTSAGLEPSLEATTSAATSTEVKDATSTPEVPELATTTSPHEALPPPPVPPIPPVRGVGSKFQGLITPHAPVVIEKADKAEIRANLTSTGTESAGATTSGGKEAADSVDKLEKSAAAFTEATEPITTRIKHFFVKILSIFSW